MTESQGYLADQLHGEPQPARPMKGDRPITPQEPGAFSQEINCMVINKQVSSNTASNLTAAHNHDMADARKRIAVLEAELKRSNIKAASNYRAFHDEQERRSKDEAAFQEYRGNLEAENAQLRADKAELVKVLVRLYVVSQVPNDKDYIAEQAVKLIAKHDEVK